jgi:hypothetical protein
MDTMVGGELGGDGRLAVVHGPRQGDDLVQLLLGEGQPGPDCGGKLVLEGDVIRNVQQRAGGGDHQPLGWYVPLEAIEERERSGEIVAPDISPVDGTRRQPRVGWEPMPRDEIDVLGPAHEIEADAVDRQCGDRRIGLADMAVCGLQQEFGRALGCREGRVGTSNGGQLGRGAVEDKRGLVELNPLRPSGGEALDDLDVDREQGVEQGQGRAIVVAHLAEKEERHRSEQHGLGGNAEGAGFVQFGERFGRSEPESLPARELGNEVVVVGIEPLGQLHGPHRLRAGAAARHGEEQITVDGVRVPAEAGRHGADERARVEHVIVEREVVDGDEVEPGGGLRRPIGAAHPGRNLIQLGGIALAGPIAFERPLQLPSLADTGISRNGGQGHDALLCFYCSISAQNELRISSYSIATLLRTA